MTLPPLLLLLVGLVMIVLGAVFVVRFIAQNRLAERPARPKPQARRGPAVTQRALLGALLVSLGLLLAVFGALALVAGPTP